MTQFVFGTGTLIGKRSDVSGTVPALIGTLESVSIDFDRKIEFLLGQNAVAVAAGGAEFKITGKAKYARMQATTINNLMLGQTMTSAGMLEMTTGEAGTIPAPSGPYTVTVANSATWTEDFGVFYAATGVQLAPVASGPTTGQYSVASGVYTFASADASLGVLIYYQYTTATAGQNKIAMANQTMGPVPTFELGFKESWKDQLGNTKDIVVKLNACVCPKLSMPFTNQKFMVQELDFQAIADAAGNVGTIGTTE